MNEKKLYSVLHQFLCKEERYPGLFGILHTDGYLVASNAYIAAKVHYEDYDFDFEGLAIDTEGKEVKARFPNYKHLFELEEMDELQDALVADIFEACLNIPIKSNKSGEFSALNIEGFFIHSCHLIKIIDLFEVIGETPAMFIGRKSRPIILKSENCIALVMPEIKAFGAKDLLFTVAEALEYTPLQTTEE